MEEVKREKDVWFKPLTRLTAKYGYGPAGLIECTSDYRRIKAIRAGVVIVEISD